MSQDLANLKLEAMARDKAILMQEALVQGDKSSLRPEAMVKGDKRLT